jgi:ABC-2 type transport system permease protein
MENADKLRARFDGVMARPDQLKAHPHAHDILHSLRVALAVLACGLVSFTLLFPVSTSAVAERSILNVNYTHEQLRFRFFDEDLSLLVTLAVCAYGVALALVLLRFLRDKRASVAFLSVGIRRWRLFAHRFVVGLLYLVVGIGLPLAASLALNVAALGWYEGEMAAFVYVFCGYCVLGLVAFCLASVACVCSGTLFECVTFCAALLGGVSALMWGLDALCAQLLVGSPFGKIAFGGNEPIVPSLLEVTDVFNPVLFFLTLGAKQQLFQIMHPLYAPAPANWVPVMGWAFFAVVAAAIAAALLSRRLGEQAQMAGMNTPLAFLAVALVAFTLFSALFSIVAPVDVVVALVCGAVAFVALSLFLLRGPLRGRTPPLRSLAVLVGECVCVGACVVVIATGAFGFAAWLPATEKVTEVSVSYVGTPSFLARPLSGSASDAAYYFHANYRFDDIADIERVRAAHEGLIVSAMLPLAKGADDFSSTVVSYDMVVRYTLVDGSEEVRYYNRARISDLACLLVLDDSARVKALERAAITADTTGLFDEDVVALGSSNTALAYRMGSVYVADANYNAITTLELGEAARAELLRVLASDVADQSSLERYDQPKQPCATLMFTLSAQTDASSFGFSFSNAVVPITPGFTKTLAWFRANGLGDYLSDGVNPALIEELSWLGDDPYSSVVNSATPALTSRFFIGYRSEFSNRFWASPDFGNVMSTSDSQQIAAVAKKLRTACFMSGGYLVQAKLQGIDAWVYYYLPVADAPEFMKTLK